LLVCQGCLDTWAAQRVYYDSGPELDQPVMVTITVAPGRRTDVPFGTAA
jgi:hypothetical protein